ncbi:MAG TPA: cell division protein ZapE [Steroidobacteraceae bacterium]|nr:cell division protein ZapE [Steroidobacteraceae bacterium]
MPRTRDLRRGYEAALERHGYAPDAAQLQAVAKLDDLALRLRTADARERGALSRVLGRLRGVKRGPGERGLYLWGGVGRGKTFLMDLFHAHVGVPARREHFHRFMKDVHARLRGARDAPDPLALVAEAMALDMRVLCLDELFVNDIADAMLLAGLFTGLVERGVTLVFTSNAPPAGLYRDGLQRQRFLPAIALIERHAEVVKVDAGHDYRLQLLEKAPLYIDARADGAHRRLERRFAELGDEEPAGPGEIEVEGRRIPYRAAAEEAIWFDFAAICDGPRSQADYVEIARDYHTVAISDVPRLDAALENQARRFIALVDEFYDRGVKLLLSAHAPPDELYAGERLGFEFERTRSRLAEMQTKEYLARPHKP